MLTQERYHSILSIINEKHAVTVSELSQLLDTSESTIRRDLTALDQLGKLKKVFGGATSIKQTIGFIEDPTSTKETLMQEEKTEIARYCATLINDTDFVYIDAGTTTGCMIDHIDCEGASFVTNGARHAIQLARRGFRVWLLSGRLKAKTEAVIGQGAVDSLQKYHFNKCFIGTDGVDQKCGLTTADIEESMVKTNAIERSQNVFILADSSKFGLVASVTFAPLDAGTIITDRLPDETYRRQAKVIELNK